MGPQPGGGNAYAVDERSVSAARIAHKIPVDITINQGVGARNLGALNAQVSLRAAPQGEREMLDDDGAGRFALLRRLQGQAGFRTFSLGHGKQYAGELATG